MKKSPAASSSAKGAADQGGTSYWAVSRGLAASLVLIVPLLVLYEAGVIMAHATPNAMEHVIKSPFFVFGRQDVMVFNLVVIAVMSMALASLLRRHALRPTVFPVMLAESLLYASLLHPLVRLALYQELSAPITPRAFDGFWYKAATAAGAGVYEEIAFRGLLLAGMVWVGARVLKAPKALNITVSVLLSAAVFSVWHFVEVGGAQWEPFLYRLVAGAALGAIYLCRGLGVAAYTHALFNVIVFCV